MGIFSSLFKASTPASRSSSVKSCPYRTSYVILDTETTGLNPSSDRIIQLSAIKYDSSGAPVDFYNTYLNPGRPISAGASKVNGITDEMVSDAPKAEEVREAFLSFLGESLIVGYNVNFDLRFLYSTFGDIFDGWGYVDALPIARASLWTSDYKLETVASYIGFEPTSSFHDSFTDCEAVAAVLRQVGADLDNWNKEFHATKCGELYSSRYKPYTRPSDIERTTDISSIDPENPFYGKTIVFTGDLRMSRAEAIQAAVNLGALVKTSVSRKTDFLVVGKQDINLVGEDGMSTKEEKAAELNYSGKAHIEILCESQFLSIIQWEAYDGRF